MGYGIYTNFDFGIWDIELTLFILGYGIFRNLGYGILEFILGYELH